MDRGTKLLPLAAAAVMFVGVVVLIVARWAWEWQDPLRPDQFKGLIYWRDYAMLFPAGVLAFLALRLALRHLPVAYSRFLQTARELMCRAERRTWRTALILAAIAGAECGAVSWFVLLTRAQTFDEACYIFTARIFASGGLWTCAPFHPEFAQTTYLVQTASKWYGAFFPGQSLMLAVGELGGAGWLVNPVLTMVLVLVTVWTGCRLFSRRVGLFAGLLFTFSPFVLFQGASYLSHIGSAILVTVAVTLALTSGKGYRQAMGCGLCIGGLLLFRPLSAAVVGVFCGGWLVLSAVRTGWRDGQLLIVRLAVLGLGFLPGIGAYFGYNLALTGDPLRTPHNVAVPSEHIMLGFHSIANTIINCVGLSVDLLGIPLLSCIPLILFCMSRARWAWPLLIFCACYVLAYSAYPYHGLSYGPRFYFELTPIMFLATAQMLATRKVSSGADAGNPARQPYATAFAFILAAGLISLAGVMPARVSIFHQRARYYAIESLVKSTVVGPSIVFIKGEEQERLFPYLAGFQLNAADFGSGKVIYLRYLVGRSREITALYPGREPYLLDMESRSISKLDR